MPAPWILAEKRIVGRHPDQVQWPVRVRKRVTGLSTPDMIGESTTNERPRADVEVLLNLQMVVKNPFVVDCWGVQQGNAKQYPCQPPRWGRKDRCRGPDCALLH
jgi:hypothetical protein